MDENGKGNFGLGGGMQFHMMRSTAWERSELPSRDQSTYPRGHHWDSWVSLGLPFGCGKDNRPGLKNRFPIAPHLKPETKFLFS